MSNQTDSTLVNKNYLMILKQILGSRLKKIRIQKGYTNLQKMTIDRKFSYSYIERGERNVQINTLAEVCLALDVTLEELFKDISLEIENEMKILEIKNEYERKSK